MPAHVKEKAIEKYLRDEINNLGGKCYKITSSSTNGMTDRLCLVMKQVWFVETKRPKNGRLSKIQEVVGQEIKDCTPNYAVAWTKTDVDKLIRKIIYNASTKILSDRN
jgi:hypothetical protein